MHRPDFNQQIKSFQNSTIIEKGYLTFRKLNVTVSKSYFKKLKPKKLTYRDYKNHSNQQFQTELVKELSENNVEASQLELFQIMSSQHLQKKV